MKRTQRSIASGYVQKTSIFKIKSSSVIKQLKSSAKATKSDCIILSLENETVVLLEFSEPRENFNIIAHLEISSLNIGKSPIEKVGDRIKVVDDLILLFSYYSNVAVLKIRRLSIRDSY